MENDMVNTAGGILAGAGALVGGAFYLRRLFQKMGLEEKRGDLAGDQVEAKNEVVNLLREEVNRLAETNKKLSEVITQLQVEVMMLRNENIKLTGEIGALQNENAQLTAEIIKLQEKVARFDVKCANCPHKGVEPIGDEL